LNVLSGENIRILGDMERKARRRRRNMHEGTLLALFVIPEEKLHAGKPLLPPTSSTRKMLAFTSKTKPKQ
jgi:hypothetical protein